jgi:hypothetical protein
MQIIVCKSGNCLGIEHLYYINKSRIGGILLLLLQSLLGISFHMSIIYFLAISWYFMHLTILKHIKNKSYNISMQSVWQNTSTNPLQINITTSINSKQPLIWKGLGVAYDVFDIIFSL